MTWTAVRREATAAEFHALDIPDPATPQVWIHETSKPALVLGSTQRPDVVDVAACERAGVDIVKRRSGGGAVLLVPGEVVWVDVILPADHAAFTDDVHRPMVWLGRHIAALFSEHGIDARVHDGAMVATDHSRLICFDGLGPGEVTVGDAKLVGISQRRTRRAARLQCCWYMRYDHSTLSELLLDAPAAEALRPVGTVGDSVAETVASTLRARLDANPSI